jgi:hypothetical protein
VLPLIPLVTDMDRFFVLPLSQNAAILYEGDARELRPLPIAGLPRNLEEARQIENADRGETLKSGARGSMKKQSAVFQRAHGRPDVIQLELREYLRQVAEVVDRRLNGESTPLVLATVEATAPIWREVSRYKFVLDDFVAGNADHLSPAELHAKAWPLVQPALAVSRRLSERRLLEAEGAKVASSLREIVPAAISGRISTLFIDCRRSRWGQYDAASHSVVLHQQREPGDQDLVELAAVETMRNGGEVFDLRPEHEGAGEAAEALLRF